MLNIIGGTYLEKCIDPQYEDLFGSGLRAAAALSNKDFEINFHSCVCENFKQVAEFKAKTYGFNSAYNIIGKTTQFHYYHPLSPPAIINLEEEIIDLPRIEKENFLYYGMIEANTKISGKYVVYDPQNHKSFKETNSSADHLALILNKKEAELLCHIKNIDLENIGSNLLQSEGAEVIVIKNGSHGALVFHDNSVSRIPVFRTNRVWPIGTGDIFSAVFAWKWIIEKMSPHDSAFWASKFVAQYCESQQLPLLEKAPLNYKELDKPSTNTKIYLAGPFFTFGERFLINELRNALLDFGNKVFSPFHDLGVLYDNYTINEVRNIAEKDLTQIRDCDVVLAVASGVDPGTIFEIGYAQSLDKKVVVLVENVKDSDLMMLAGTGCIFTDDLSTAVYKASW